MSDVALAEDGSRGAGLDDVLPARSLRKDAWRRFRRNRLAMLGLFMVLFLVLVAIFGPFLVQDPNYQVRELSKSTPDWDHWFGTNQLGQDMLARVVYGVRISLFIGLLTTFLETVIGITFGAISGWVGGKLDTVLMRIVDIMLGIPYILIAFALISVIGKGLGAVVLTLAVTSWLTTARVIRAGFLQAKQLEYVEAARAVGVRPKRIVFRHILPNVIQPVIVLVAIGIGSAILAEAALSFLGVGLPPLTASLGILIDESRSHFSSAPHLLFFPGLAIVLTVLGFLLIGDGLRDALDVKD